jgi:hypothetical protein
MFYKNGNTTSTLIDVVLHNKNLITTTKVVPCPFSDHDFVVSYLNVPKISNSNDLVTVKTISTKSLELINDKLRCTDFSVMNKFDSVNDKWTVFKNIILGVVRKFSFLIVTFPSLHK